MLQLDHLLNLWIDIVECGNTFVYEMNGCKDDIIELIESKGVHDHNY